MQDKDVNKFLRAAEQRLTSARILFENNMYLDCMYIAGYAPECALKALILAQVPRYKRVRFIREHFRGAVAHEFEYLKNLLRRLNVHVPLTISRLLRTIASWSTDLRYEVGRKRPQEAQEFLFAAQAVRDWAQRSL